MPQAVERNAIVVWRWETLFASFVMLGVCSAVLFTSRVPLIIVITVVAVLALALAAWITWYPPAKWRHMGWRLDDTGITIHAGVFLRTQTSVARARIQHTDVFQGPLQRHYGIATLKLYTAGSHFSRIELPGLSHENAVRLRDELQGGAGSDAV